MIPKESYYGIKAISNSALGYINPEEGGSPQKFKAFLDGTLEDSGAKHFINGTLIHMSILEPEKFVIANVLKPAAALGDIADAMVIQGLDLLDDNILNTIRAFGWQNNWGDDTVLKKFKDAKGPEYVEYMSNLKNTGKIGMDATTGKTVESCKSAFLLNERTNFYLKEIDEMDGMECLNELEVQWQSELRGEDFNFKSKLDRLIINHHAKTFTIVDVKTTGKPIGQFQYSFESYRYPRQIKFYKNAATQYLNQKGLENYKFDKAFIAAVETHGYYSAQLFDVTKYVNKPCKELSDLINRVVFHTQQFDWVNPMEAILNNGIVELAPLE